MEHDIIHHILCAVLSEYQMLIFIRKKDKFILPFRLPAHAPLFHYILCSIFFKLWTSCDQTQIVKLFRTIISFSEEDLTRRHGSWKVYFLLTAKQMAIPLQQQFTNLLTWTLDQCLIAWFVSVARNVDLLCYTRPLIFSPPISDPPK